MIALTRLQLRRLRGVFRRSALGIAHRGPILPIVLAVEGGQLHARHRHGALAVEHAGPCRWPSSGSVALPLDALADLEGRDEAVVAIDPAAPGRTVARWAERSIPRAREYAVPAIEPVGPLPPPPEAWADLAPGLLDALAEAVATAADDDTRYALSCLALRGGSGTIAATDGRQVLIRSGFAFPWDGEVLIPRSPLFACRELPRDLPVHVGKTDDHVVLRVGPWTISSQIKAGVRFPDVDRILPGPGSVATRLRLDPGDARFLAESLGRLPGAGAANSPATLDLNGEIAVRARGSEREPATELVLSRSTYSGDPVRLHVNRELLGRAIRLGCGELEVADADAPVVGRNGDRVYAWQPLAKASAIEPSPDAVRVESCLTPPPEPLTPDPPAQRKPDMSAHELANDHEVDPPDQPDTHPPAEAAPPTGLAGLIAEAEALHQALGGARSRAGQLVVALRKQKRREKLVTSTLASLRQLRLQDVAD